MDTIGKRLRWAIREVFRGSIRQFQRGMDERGIAGSSPPAVNRYLKDLTEPSIKWLREAAGLLGVSEDWLILGKGQPTKLMEADAAAARERTKPARAASPIDLTD
ncbi:MAG: helix-turn-helix domain-containing protein, partial [Gemmatimonadales bacterium]